MRKQYKRNHALWTAKDDELPILGTMASKFNDAMESKISDLQKFFANSDTTTSTNDGMAQRIKSLTTQILDPEGTIANSTSGLKKAIDRNKDKIEQINDRASLYENRLRKQYTALDSNMSRLSGLSSYVSAQLAALYK